MLIFLAAIQENQRDCLCEQVYTVSQKKLDPFSFEPNFGKYCPILIILSLLQTEINYDKVTSVPLNLPPYLKSASALPGKMNKNVLANIAGMIS